MNTIIKYNLFIFILLCFFSCNENKTVVDTPTSGKINILVDETYRPIIEQEIAVFESHYKDAKINAYYRPAMEIMNQMGNDSFRLFISSITPDTNQFIDYFTKNNYYPKKIKISKDAIAIISNQSKKDLKISLSDLKKILSGEITDYKQIKDCPYSGKIILVFDNDKSSTLIYMRDSILKGMPFSKEIFAKNTNEEVLKYVQTTSNALGVIGVSWISDESDEEAHQFLKNISVVKIGNSEISNYFYEPHHAWVAINKYPLTRYMLATLKEYSPNLGTGFVNFLTGEYGQKIILNSGLVPTNQVLRVVDAR